MACSVISRICGKWYHKADHSFGDRNKMEGNSENQIV